jgi:uncharacterized protein (UPF0264 family)
MHLLISVTSPTEARAALAGGADIIDAKDPTRGSLGAVEREVLGAIVEAVGGERRVSAALGDAESEEQVARAAREAVVARVSYVKVGFAGVSDPGRVEALVAAAVREVELVSGSAGVVAVAYADAERAGSVAPLLVVEAAARAGALGVLLDTAFKDGGALFQLLHEDTVRDWVRAARERSLFTALAGRLNGVDLATARALGADVAGVRGAACDGGRTGQVSVDRVRALAAVVRRRRVSSPTHGFIPVADTATGGDVTLPATPP